MVKSAKDNGWEEYKRLILDKMDQHTQILNQIDERLRKIENGYAETQVVIQRTDDLDVRVRKVESQIIALLIKVGIFGTAGLVFSSIGGFLAEHFLTK